MMENKLYGILIQLSGCNLHLHFHEESDVEFGFDKYQRNNAKWALHSC